MGNLFHRFENEKELHLSDLLENIIVASSQQNGHILQFKAGLRTVLNSLKINKKEFIVNKDCILKSLKKTLETLFRDEDASQMFYHHGNHCVRLADLYIELNGFPKKEFLRSIFFEGSAFKILTLQILQYQNEIALPENKTVLRKFEIQQVQLASEIIDNEILNYKTVQELTNRVGLNTNKLQNGFKQIYDITVNGYVHDRRLDVANSLHKNSDFNISEIVYMVGLSSKSYFSKIFKEKYGISPSLVHIHSKNGSNNK